jgi:2',3'-cyclic-nucleotide 2'-phosphodiesterase (5'-nucleotidase family)
LLESENPPAVVANAHGHDETYAKPQQIGSNGVWVLSYEDDVDILRQLRLTLSNDRRKVTNVTVIENGLKTIPDYIKDDALRVDIAYLKELTDEAKANDPIVGYSTAMPVSRVDFFRACFGGECPLENLFTDALRWSTGADFAFVQSGVVRGPSWPAGPVKVSGLISIEFLVVLVVIDEF